MRLFRGIFKGYPAGSGASQAPAANGKPVRLQPPQDMHWLCACRLLSNDPDPWAGIPMLCSLFVVVFLQGHACMVLILTIGNTHGACLRSDDCGPRLFCSAQPHPRAGHTGAGECLNCHHETLLCTEDGQVAPDWNNDTHILDSDWSNQPHDKEGLVALCERCMDPVRGYFSR